MIDTDVIIGIVGAILLAVNVTLIVKKLVDKLGK